MQMIIAFAAILALAVAAPQYKDVEIRRYDNDNIGVDGYKYGYELSNGQVHEEAGVLKNVGTDNEAISVTGRFSYVGADGVTYTVTYVADENGFQPQGAHIPHEH